MIKVLRILFCLLSSLFVFQISTFAINVTDIAVETDVDPNVMIVSIKGNIGTGESGKDVSLQVINPDENIANYTEHPDSAINIFNRLAQTKTTNGGLFEFKYDISKSTDKIGDFTVRLNTLDGEVYQATLKYYSKAALDQLLTDINECVPNTNLNTANIQKLTDIINNKSDMFISYFPLYDTVKQTGNISDIATRISFLNKFDLLKNFTNVFKTSVFIQAIYQENDINEIMKIIDENYNVTDLSNTISFDDYYASSSDAKVNICTKLKKLNKNYTTFNSFYDDFNTAVVLYKLETVNGTGAVEAVIEKYKDLFDLSTYNSSTNYKTGMLKNLAAAAQRRSLLERSDIQSILNNIVPIPASSGSTSSGGGGNKSGGSNFSTVSAPISTPSYNDNALVKPDNGFEDLDTVTWAKESINNLTKLGIVSGYTQSTFGPLDNITRAQFCKMLAKCFGLEEEKAESIFIDVDTGEWYYGYVSAMKNHGIVNGYEDNTFRPDSNISRQDLAVIAYKMLEYFGYKVNSEKSESGFTDYDQINEYALSAVNALGSIKVISGSDKGTYNPYNNATRAEAAKIIYGLYQYIKGEV